MEELSFIDYAVCKNCKKYHKNKCRKPHKKGNSEWYTEKDTRPKGHCSFFELKSEELKYKKKQNDKDKLSEEHFKDKLLSVYSLEDILSGNIPKIEWLVRDLVIKGGITFFGGTSGSFKTWAALQLALDVANGESYMGEFSTMPSNVLYIDEENGFVTIPNRFSSLVKGNSYESKKFNNVVVSIFNNVFLDNAEGQEFLKLLIYKHNPSLIIIDSLVRCMCGEEDKAKDVKLIFENFKPYLEEGRSFVILHHTTKRETNSMVGLRGSGDFAAFADVVVMFNARTEGYFDVNIVKNRHIELNESSNFFGKIDNIGDEKCKLVYQGIRCEGGNVIENCADDIDGWIRGESLKSFSSQDCCGSMRNKGHKRNRVYSAIKLLVDNHKLIKLKRGKYKVNEEYFSTVEHKLV